MTETQSNFNGIWLRFTTGPDPRTLTTDTHDFAADLGDGQFVTRCGAEKDQEPGAWLGKVDGQLTCRRCIELLETAAELDAVWLDAWNRRAH